MPERRYHRAPWEGASRRGASLSRAVRAMNPLRDNGWIMRPTEFSTTIESWRPSFDEYITDYVTRWVDAYDMNGDYLWSLGEKEPKIEPNVALLFE